MAMNKQLFALLHSKQINRRDFLRLSAEAALLLAIWDSRAAYATAPQQPAPSLAFAEVGLQAVGYGEGSYDAGQYPAEIMHHSYLPLVRK